MSRELIVTTAEDLRFLAEDWDQDIDEHSLRRSSPILRRLLVEGVLQRAWNGAGFSRAPTIEALTLRALLQTYTQQEMILAAAGGAFHHGGFMGRTLVGPRDPDDPPPIPREAMTLNQFIEDPCLVILGEKILRRQLIQYVANKLGGVHHDEKRTSEPKDQTYTLLDWAAEKAEFVELRMPYFALLATGQALIWSADIRNFVEQTLGRPLRGPEVPRWP